MLVFVLLWTSSYFLIEENTVQMCSHCSSTFFLDSLAPGRYFAELLEVNLETSVKCSDAVSLGMDKHLVHGNSYCWTWAAALPCDCCCCFEVESRPGAYGQALCHWATPLALNKYFLWFYLFVLFWGAGAQMQELKCRTSTVLGKCASTAELHPQPLLLILVRRWYLSFPNAPCI